MEWEALPTEAIYGTSLLLLIFSCFANRSKNDFLRVFWSIKEYNPKITSDGTSKFINVWVNSILGYFFRKKLKWYYFSFQIFFLRNIWDSNEFARIDRCRDSAMRNRKTKAVSQGENARPLGLGCSRNEKASVSLVPRATPAGMMLMTQLTILMKD